VTEVSGRLRAARERAGLTIRDISASTKISAATLNAIERGEFDKLPGDFYVRNFLRSYAREVHLPPDEIVREYDASRGITQPQPEAVTALHTAVTPDTPVKGSPRRDLEPGDTGVPAGPARILSFPRNARAVGALVAMLIVVSVLRNLPPDTRPPESGAVGTSGVAEAAPAPVPSAGTPASAGAGPAPEKLILEIHPSAPIWVAGAADGNRVVYRMLAPGERVIVEGRNELSFRIGNAAAFTYSLNGAPGKPLGGVDEVREFQITPANYRTFRR
jgi:cytoskeletal protein RodZ